MYERTAKLNSANVYVSHALMSTWLRLRQIKICQSWGKSKPAKYNSRQYFLPYGMAQYCSALNKHKHLSGVKITLCTCMQGSSE